MRALRRSVARARGEDLRTREQLVAHARLTASAEPVYTGYGTLLDRQTIARCRHDFRSGDLVHLLLFTRDGGMHSSGWWKNPDYERCWHLSLSFLDAETAESAPHDHGEARRWCELFFGDHTRYLWIEPPFSDHGRARHLALPALRRARLAAADPPARRGLLA